LQNSLFKAQEQPLKLEERRARAGEAGARQKAQETATKLSQQHIDEAIRSSGYKQINDMGAALEQFGTIAKQNGGSLPLQYLSMVPKDTLPLFDMPNGADIALQAGKAIREKSGAWQLLGSKQEAAQGLVDTKAEAAAEVARINAAARIKATELANTRAKAALAAKPAKQDALSYEKYAQKLDAHADELAMLGDAESLNKAQYFKSLAADYYARAVKLKTAPTDVRTDATTSLETELGIRKPKPTGQAASAAPATPNDRVRVQSADGKIGTIPKSQLKEAMAQGYKEYK